MILGALIQHWLCYWRYPDSRCITLFHSPDAASRKSEAVTISNPATPAPEQPRAEVDPLQGQASQVR